MIEREDGEVMPFNSVAFILALQSEHLHTRPDSYPSYTMHKHMFLSGFLGPWLPTTGCNFSGDAIYSHSEYSSGPLARQPLPDKVLLTYRLRWLSARNSTNKSQWRECDGLKVHRERGYLRRLDKKTPMPLEESRISIQMFFFEERYSPFRIIVLQDGANFQDHDPFNNRCNDYLPQNTESSNLVNVVPDMPHLYALQNAVAEILQTVWAREWDMLLDDIDDCVRVKVILCFSSCNTLN